MLEIFFTACLLSNPAHCAEKSITYSDMTDLQCMSASQTEIAQWAIVHPGYFVSKWGCRRAGLSANL